MGKPVPLYRMAILRGDGTECDTGETGEICIGIDPHPAGIMMEYYRNPEKTAEAMYDGWYHTGDTAWRDEEGNYWYVGRNDDVIKSSGYRQTAPYKYPRIIEYVDDLPRTVNGKIRRAAIREADRTHRESKKTPEGLI